MTSSSSYEIELSQDRQPLDRLVVEEHRLPARLAFERSARTDRSIQLRVTAPSSAPPFRLELGDAIAGVVREDARELRVDLTDLLRDGWGEAVLRARPSEDEDEEGLLFELLIPLETPAEVERLYEHLIHDLESAHLGLARDILGRTSSAAGQGAPRVFDPVVEARTLAQVLERMAAAVDRIGQQPSTELTREPQRVRWRPGDPIDVRAAVEVGRQLELDRREGRPGRIGHLVVRRPRLSYDLPEHRHLRAGLAQLVRRAETLVAGCERAIDLLSSERAAWGSETATRASVYSQRFQPRVAKLEGLASSGRRLRHGFRSVIEKHDFVREASKPRRRLAPSPLFLRRSGYREVYRLLQGIRSSSATFDGQALRIHLRSLDLLYEYWCFIAVVRELREQLGAPDEGDGFEVIDEVYRPELRPGQFFGWSLRGHPGSVRAYYEPSLPPWGAKEEGPYGWQASLVSAPLRPDVLIVIEEEDGRRGLVLDAKNTTRFGRERLFDYSDYRTLVHDPETGEQPIRQAFLLHRDTDGTHCTWPGYFEEGGAVPAGVSILGAIPFLPDEKELLQAVLARFLQQSPSDRPKSKAS